MKALPDHVKAYRATPVFDEATVPAGLLADHATKAGVWGVIEIEAGRLRYEITEQGETHELNVDHPGVVEPEVRHRVTPIGKVRFRVRFYR